MKKKMIVLCAVVLSLILAVNPIMASTQDIAAVHGNCASVYDSACCNAGNGLGAFDAELVQLLEKFVYDLDKDVHEYDMDSLMAMLAERGDITYDMLEDADIEALFCLIGVHSYAYGFLDFIVRECGPSHGFCFWQARFMRHCTKCSFFDEVSSKLIFGCVPMPVVWPG